MINIVFLTSIAANIFVVYKECFNRSLDHLKMAYQTLSICYIGCKKGDLNAWRSPRESNPFDSTVYIPLEAIKKVATALTNQ